MIVVTGTAAVVLVIVGLALWIIESTAKAQRLAAQRAKNKQLRAQAPAAAPSPVPAAQPQAGQAQQPPPAMPYGM